MGCNNSKEAYKAEYANPNTTTTDDNDAGGDAKAAEETDPKLRTQQQKEGGDGGGDVEEEEGQTVICTRCRNANPHTSQRCAMCGLALVQIMIAPLQAARRDAHDAKKQQSPRGALMGKIPAFASRREDKEPGIPVAPPVVMRQLSVEQGMQESAQNLTHARGALLHAIKDGRNLRTARIGQKKRPVNALLHKVRLPVVSAAQAKLLATPAPPAPPVLKPIEKKSELIHKPDLWKGVMKELTTPNPRGQPTKVFSDLTHDEQGYVTRALENTVDEEGFYVSLGHLNQKIQVCVCVHVCVVACA
jgi:ribosomal protein L34E